MYKLGSGGSIMSGTAPAPSFYHSSSASQEFKVRNIYKSAGITIILTSCILDCKRRLVIQKKWFDGKAKKKKVKISLFSYC